MTTESSGRREAKRTSSDLGLHEELVLLALHDDRGTFRIGSEQPLAGALLAELLLHERIRIDGTKRQMVDVVDPTPTGDPVVDAALARILEAKRRASLTTWIGRIARLKRLRHRVAQQLSDSGILRHERSEILGLIPREVYPEFDPLPEQAIIARLRSAIFTDRPDVAPRTMILLALTKDAGLLERPFGRSELRGRNKRIRALTDADQIGAELGAAMAAVQAALAAATVVAAGAATAS